MEDGKEHLYSVDFCIIALFFYNKNYFNLQTYKGFSEFFPQRVKHQHLKFSVAVCSSVREGAWGEELALPPPPPSALFV